MGTLGIERRPRMQEEVEHYTPQEAESIRRQMEWLGYA